MRKPVFDLLVMILAIVGVLEMNPLLLGLAAVGIAFIVIGWFQVSSQKKKEKQKNEAYCASLNRYLAKHQDLAISDHVRLHRDGQLQDYLAVQIYYDEEYVGTLKDFQRESAYQDTFKKIDQKIKDLALQGDIVDENHNGVDDRLEAQRRAGYYAKEIRRAALQFDHPSISAGLKEVAELLDRMASLEEKYPQINSRLRKLYQHYLPLLMNILDQYQTLKDKQASASEIAVMETKLEKAILLVNEALRTLMANFISDDLINMSSDISVLEAILKRDGLVQEGTLGGMKSER